MRRALDFRSRPFLNDHFPNVVGKIEQLLNGGSASISRAVTFQTALALVKDEVPILFGIQARLHKNLVRMVNRPATVRADHALQTLRQNAVERRNEVIWIDTHIQK